MMRPALPFTIGVLLTGMAWADSPQVVTSSATRDADGSWTISVSIQHPDTGWDHFANGWQVLTPDGAIIGYRELAHPHVDEQPFTRSLSGVKIPANVGAVLIRPHCTMDGWAAMPTMLVLPKT